MFFISLIFTPISSLIAIVLNLMLKFIIKIAEITANMPFSKITIITPSFFFIIVWYLIIISISYKQKVKIFYHKNNKLIKKIVSCILIIVLIVNLIIKVDKKLEIHFVEMCIRDRNMEKKLEIKKKLCTQNNIKLKQKKANHKKKMKDKNIK